MLHTSHRYHTWHVPGGRSTGTVRNERSALMVVVSKLDCMGGLELLTIYSYATTPRETPHCPSLHLVHSKPCAAYDRIPGYLRKSVVKIYGDKWGARAGRQNSKDVLSPQHTRHDF